MASEWPAFYGVCTAFRRPTIEGFEDWPVDGGNHWVDEVPYIHRDAARAWQAFRDFLNGVGGRVLLEGATFKGPRPGAWLTIDPKTGVQTFDLRGATITYGGSDD